MLDRPIPFNTRLRATWPVVTTPDAAIFRALEALAQMPEGSQRRDDRSVAMRERRPRSYSSARASGAF